MGSSYTKEQEQHALELSRLVQQNCKRQVSDKEILELLSEIDQSCAWYPLHGSLKLEVWQRIGKELQSEPRASITCLLTWKVIYEALSVFHGNDNLVLKEAAEENLSSPQFVLAPPAASTALPPPPVPLAAASSAVPSPTLDPLPSAPVEKQTEALSESSREGCVAACIREAWRTGQIDTTEEWGGDSPCMFPLIRTPVVNAQGQQGYQLRWEALPYAILRELNKSAREDGLQSTYFHGMLEGVHNGHLMLPQDWKDMMRMLLTPAQYVIWDSEFKQAALKGQTAAITAEQIYGTGQFATIQAQLQLTDQHLNATWLCIQRALRRVPGRSSVTKSFSSIRQGPNEPYTSFVDKLKVAISRQLDNVEAQSELLLKLAYENANADCKKALRGVISKEPYELADMLRACAEVGSKAHEMALLAVALRGGKGNCFNCKKPGHFKAECRAPGGGACKEGGRQRPQKPSRKCPRCGKGYHWASQCRSNPQRNATSQQGN
uniref:Gag polyprotein n=1 Tax=Pogona vitticeps TaxID=103695 RepID=A0ABM5GDA5_9SAUR